MITLELPVGTGTRSWTALQHAAAARGVRGLARGTMMRAEALPGQRVRCDEGCVWVTADGSGEDIVLGAGDEREFAGRARLLIEALEDSRIRVGNR